MVRRASHRHRLSRSAATSGRRIDVSPARHQDNRDAAVRSPLFPLRPTHRANVPLRGSSSRTAGVTTVPATTTTPHAVHPAGQVGQRNQPAADHDLGMAPLHLPLGRGRARLRLRPALVTAGSPAQRVDGIRNARAPRGPTVRCPSLLGHQSRIPNHRPANRAWYRTSINSRVPLPSLVIITVSPVPAPKLSTTRIGSPSAPWPSARKRLHDEQLPAFHRRMLDRRRRIAHHPAELTIGYFPKIRSCRSSNSAARG